MNGLVFRSGADAPSGYLAELGSIVHARWLVVLRVYLDESEQEQARVFTVAGHVFDPSGARRFEKPWRRAPDSAQLPRFLMSELEKSKAPTLHGRTSTVMHS
jgi:hypothetical protein